MKSKKIIIGICIAVIAFAVFIVSYFFLQRNAEYDFALDKSLQQFEATQARDINYGEGILLSESNGAKEIFVAFDFLCPECVELVESLVKFSSEKKINLRLLYYPLSQRCNPILKIKGQSLSCDLAFLNLCQEQKGIANLETVTQILAQIEKLDLNRLDSLKERSEVLRKFNISDGDFQSCIQDPKVKGRLDRMIREAERLDIHQLPGLFIDGRAFYGYADFETLKKIILR